MPVPWKHFVIVANVLHMTEYLLLCSIFPFYMNAMDKFYQYRCTLDLLSFVYWHHLNNYEPTAPHHYHIHIGLIYFVIYKSLHVISPLINMVLFYSHHN